MLLPHSLIFWRSYIPGGDFFEKSFSFFFLALFRQRAHIFDHRINIRVFPAIVGNGISQRNDSAGDRYRFLSKTGARKILERIFPILHEAMPINFGIRGHKSKGILLPLAADDSLQRIAETDDPERERIKMSSGYMINGQGSVIEDLFKTFGEKFCIFFFRRFFLSGDFHQGNGFLQYALREKPVAVIKNDMHGKVQPAGKLHRNIPMDAARDPGNGNEQIDIAFLVVIAPGHGAENPDIGSKSAFRERRKMLKEYVTVLEKHVSRAHPAILFGPGCFVIHDHHHVRKNSMEPRGNARRGNPVIRAVDSLNPHMLDLGGNRKYKRCCHLSKMARLS